MIDARKHEAFSPDEEPNRDAFNALSLSIRDVIPVANVTERAQVVAALTDAGAPPSVNYPIYVHRQDAHPTSPLEFTVDGSTWRRSSPIVERGIASLTGTTLVPAGGAYAGGQVIFNTAMPTGNYDIQVTLRGVPGGSAYLVARVASITVAGFTVWIFNTGSGNQFWNTGSLTVGWVAIHP